MTESPNTTPASSPHGDDSSWTPPPVDLESVKTGDMPGDKIQISQSHIDMANTVFPHLVQELSKLGGGRIVVSVYGGSGVGKSELGSVLGFYCQQRGFAPYVLSGDNYPHRIPELNDLERLSVFRNAALRAFAMDPEFSDARMDELHELWPSMDDMRSSLAEDVSPLGVYYRAGRDALDGYLGSEQETDFAMVNSIIQSFKNGEDAINLKRMGRSSDDIRYESVDFSDVRVLIVEWTHGNNPLLHGVDYPIFLFSTPGETLAHRLARGRDKNTDSPMIGLVLGLEHEKLISQADRAALILSKSGELLPFAELQRRIAE